MGAGGTGKSHLPVTPSHKDCAQGHRVVFHRAANLTQKLIEKHREGQVEKLMAKIARAELFVLDEVGYVPFDKKDSQLLFQMISRSYETQSVIITTNLEFGRWNEMFGDAKLTAALVDRLIHHAHILNFEGESFQFKQAIKTTKKRVPP
jgi:DNA replication protein DnaC